MCCFSSSHKNAITRPLLCFLLPIAHYLPCSPPLCSLLSAVHFPAVRRQLPGRPPNTYRQSNTPKLSSISPKVFCITPKVLKNALAAFFLSRLVLFSQFFRLSALYFKIIAYICTCNPKGKQRHIARFRTLVHIVQIYRAKL